MKEEYIINNDTVVVMSVSSSCCLVYELNNIFKVNKSLNSIIRLSCKYYGSSFKGRIEGSKYLIDSKYKLPIILNDFKNMVFFPLKSYRYKKNCIVLLNNIKNYKKKDKKTEIISTFNKKIFLDISYGIFERQFIKAQKLLLIIKNI